MKHENIHNRGENLKEFILGGQDGLVNVLGLVLGVAAATNQSVIVIVSALAATFAESISMAAVAYTSVKAAKQYYMSQLAREKQEMRDMPKIETKEIRDIYYARGFRGKLLDDVVHRITSNNKIWLDVMMAEELRLFPKEYSNPLRSGIFVGLSSFIGSIIPVIPFFIIPVYPAMITSIIIAALALFITGAVKAKLTIGDWKRNGIEMMLIGIIAALIGYGVGIVLKMIFPQASI